nr:DUF4393 domain-containing protein [uncultured Trichococcus sp.]
MNDVIVSAAMTAFITSMATKGAEAPANTINHLWKQIFGPLDMYLQKNEIKRQNNLKKYVNSIEEAAVLIPDEYIQEPKISILGPALEASKFYIEEEEIRDMFANLIASSMDNRKNEYLHHSFVEIIKQMSPHDGNLIKLFLKITSYPVVSVTINSGKGTNQLIDLLFLEIGNNYELNAISLINLQRLGLIEIRFDKWLTANNMYDKYFQSKEFQDLKINNRIENSRRSYQADVNSFGKEKVMNFMNVTSEELDALLIPHEPELAKGLVKITPLGNAFLKICY